MAFGFGVLRLAPDAFWAMSPRELAAAARAIHGEKPAPPDTAALQALMAAFGEG
jgi:uncharacterized phage protein (TIGR02216 family)